MTHPTSDLAEITVKLDELIRVVGKESDDGKSGTGLIGEVRRATVQLQSITDLRNKGAGFIGAITLLLGLLGFTFNHSWISALFGGHK